MRHHSGSDVRRDFQSDQDGVGSGQSRAIHADIPKFESYRLHYVLLLEPDPWIQPSAPRYWLDTHLRRNDLPLPTCGLFDMRCLSQPEQVDLLPDAHQLLWQNSHRIHPIELANKSIEAHCEAVDA